MTSQLPFYVLVAQLKYVKFKSSPKTVAKYFAKFSIIIIAFIW